MSVKLSRAIAQSLRVRLYGTQAASASPAESLSGIKVSKLKNGITLATVDNSQKLTRISAVVKAGPRYESSDDLGIAHYLRRGALLSTKNYTTFGMIRNLQQIGASLSCTSTRELMFYNLVGLRNENLSKAVEILEEVLLKQAFNHWELGNVGSSMELDLAHLEEDRNIKLTELLHDAAYNGTLGRSLYAPNYKLGTYTREQLFSYLKCNYTGSRIVMVGTGIDHDDLAAVAEEFTPYSSSGSVSGKVVYTGGESRLNSGGNFAHVALVNEGVGLNSQDLITSLVLQMIMGTSPSIKYADTSSSTKLGQAVSQVTTNPYSISCLNFSYSDSGLFGFHAQGTKDDIEKIVRAAVQQFSSLTKSGVSDQEVTRGKNKVKSALATYLDTGEGLVTDIAEQLLVSQGQVYELPDILKAVDEVKTTDVVALAKRIVNGTPTLAATGNLEKMPHVHELF